MQIPDGMKRNALAALASVVVVLVACSQGTADDVPIDDGTGGTNATEGPAPGGGSDKANPSGSQPAPSCTDRTRNGNEVDVDCGGSCGPCADGKHCASAADCSSHECTAGMCCTTKTYEKTSGPVSGTTQLCCAAGDELVTFSDCGTGHNHSVMPAGNCAFTAEGPDNYGSACSKISCRSSTCSKSCQGNAYMKATGPGGGQVCCNPGDKLVKVVDCGDGHNHSVSTSGTCGVAVEGKNNYGSACAQIFCATNPCPGGADGGVGGDGGGSDGSSGGPPK
jgi:hypothetical protein